MEHLGIKTHKNLRVFCVSGQVKKQLDDFEPQQVVSA